MRIMISCGEPSGDLYGAALAAEIRLRQPSADIFGFGGPRLAAAGARLVGDFHGLSVTGLTEAIRVLPRSFAMLRRLAAAARSERPDVFVAIDFPDFNFRLMAAIHRLGIPVVYYISPQLWAWRPGRMRTMKRFVSQVLVIFPFEEDLYRSAGVPVQFVGHPLVDLLQVTEGRSGFLSGLGLDADRPTVALLPGSRVNELRRIVPVLAESLPLIRTRVSGVQFVIAAAPNLSRELFAPLLAGGSGDNATPVLVHARTDDVIASADVVITASGTATVQTALHEKPMVVVYRLSPLTYRIGKPWVLVDTYAMANLVAGRRVVPELIQEEFTAPRVADETVRLLIDQDAATAMREGLRIVYGQKLGQSGASGRAAEAVIAIARGSERTGPAPTSRA